MTRIAQSFDDQDDDRQPQRQAGREGAAPRKFKQSPRPQRQRGSVSFNGLHRRRNKRIQW